MRGFELHPRLRVTAISVCAFGATMRGLAYINAPNTRFTTFVDVLIPLHLWALVWVAAGLMMIAGIWHRIIARWALALGASLWAVWALSYTLSWLIGEQSRAWVTAAAMATIAGLMWIIASLADSVGPPGEPVIPDDGEGDPS